MLFCRFVVFNYCIFNLPKLGYERYLKQFFCIALLNLNRKIRNKNLRNNIWNSWYLQCLNFFFVCIKVPIYYHMAWQKLSRKLKKHRTIFRTKKKMLRWISSFKSLYIVANLLLHKIFLLNRYFHLKLLQRFKASIKFSCLIRRKNAYLKTSFESLNL